MTDAVKLANAYNITPTRYTKRKMGERSVAGNPPTMAKTNSGGIQ
jgi:hypothetical protein